jgi:hypothetical protein
MALRESSFSPTRLASWSQSQRTHEWGSHYSPGSSSKVLVDSNGRFLSKSKRRDRSGFPTEAQLNARAQQSSMPEQWRKDRWVSLTGDIDELLAARPSRAGGLHGLTWREANARGSLSPVMSPVKSPSKNIVHSQDSRGLISKWKSPERPRNHPIMESTSLPEINHLATDTPLSGRRSFSRDVAGALR